jgi:DNA-directed RNA polymerase specialized sigma24 family protein
MLFAPYDEGPVPAVTARRDCITRMTGSGVANGELRPLMFSIAYRMLGSVTEAEDVVQEAFVRLHTSAPHGLRSADAYAVTVTTRLAIDALRSGRRRREQYIGPWLPEPLIAAEEADPALQIEMDETVSVALPGAAGKIVAGWRAQQAFAAALPESWVQGSSGTRYRLSAD